MKVSKNNVTYIWASVCIWILGCSIFGWALPKSNTGVIIAVVLYLLPAIPLVMLFKYYKHDPDGIKAQKEADENREEKRKKKSPLWVRIFNSGMTDKEFNDTFHLK